MSLWQRIHSLFFIVLLVSCGGGDGSLERTETPGTPNPDPESTTAYAVALNLTTIDSEDTRSVSQASPGFLVATLTKDGSPLAYEVVSFNVESVGVINPSVGTALTDETGVARVTLLPGNQQGAGRAVVTYTPEDEDESITSDFSFTSAGDAPAGNSSDFIMTLDLTDGSTNQPTVEVSATNPAVLVVSVRDGSGTSIVGRVVQFSSTLGTLSPASGTALTDSTGTATIILNAGSIEGAGEVTAAFESAEITSGFYTRGDQIDPDLVEASVVFDILNCPDGWDRQTRDRDLCTVTNNISPSEPGIVYIDVDRKGTTQALSEVLVVGDSTIGRISPDNKTAITDSNGIALLDLLAANDVGAGELSVVAIDTTARKAFQIGAADVSLDIDNGLAVGDSLAAGSTTVISVQIVDNDAGGLYQPPVSVEFSSSCAIAETAVLDEKVVSIGGVASATYRANGCVGDDEVTASAIVGGEAITVISTVSVAESNVGGIEFVSSTPNELSLKGTGGLTDNGDSRSETAIVVFRVVDESGQPDPQELIKFNLSTEIGGVSISPSEAFSNNEGLVQVVVTSGNIPTSVRVQAILDDGTDPDAKDNRISSVSDKLVISTGVPDQNSFSLSLSNHRPEALTRNGTDDIADPGTVVATAYVSDHFNNPVPDGTSVYFTTEGGSVEPSCETINGKCSVLWWGQDPRPFAGEPADYGNSINDVGCYADYNNNNIPDAGDGIPAPCLLGDMIVRLPISANPPRAARATITAHATGEESFTDLNGNGVFDGNEFNPLHDLDEAYVDHNENGSYDGVDCTSLTGPCAPANSTGGEYEEFFDFNNDGLHTAADGTYNGLLCTEVSQAAGDCSWGLTHVRDSQVIVMSGSGMYFRTRQNGLDVDEVTESVGSFFGVDVLISDIYGNLPPTGSTISITSSKGSLKSDASFKIADGISAEALAFGVQIEIPSTETPGGGVISIKVETPGGVISSHSVTLNVI